MQRRQLLDLRAVTLDVAEKLRRIDVRTFSLLPWSLRALLLQDLAIFTFAL